MYRGIEIKFLTSEKSYYFKIDPEFSQYLSEELGDDLFKHHFYIKNEHNYNYHNSVVRVCSANFPLVVAGDKLELIMLKDSVTQRVFSVEDLPKGKSKKSNEREELKMKDNALGLNIEFGKVVDVKMSMYGPAFFTSERKHIAYDEKSEKWVDVSQMTFDFNIGFYKVPVAKKDVKCGDYIRHNGAWARVIELKEEGRLLVENIGRNEVAEIIAVKNLFGFDFYTKLVNMFDMNGNSLFGSVSEDSPFGNMLPLMMMNDSNSFDGVDDMLPLMMMSGGFNSGEMFSNPLMMYMMMKDNKDSNMLPLMMMMGGINK